MEKLKPTIERREYRAAPLKRASWGAVFGGVAITFALMLTLGVLGVAVGFTALDPGPGGEGSPSPTEFGIGAGLWWLFTGIISIAIGAFAAGRLAGLRRRFEGMTHGIVTWGVSILIMVFLMTTAVGTLVSGGLNVIGSVVSPIASAAGGAVEDAVPSDVDMPDVNWQQAWSEAEQALRETGAEGLEPEQIQERYGEIRQAFEQAASAENPQQAQQELAQGIDTLIQKSRETITAADKEAVVNLLVQYTGLEKAEAEKRVEGWSNLFQAVSTQASQTVGQAKKTALSAADTAAHGVAQAAWWTFFYFVITALVAGAAGALGAPKGERKSRMRRREDDEPVATA